MSTTSLIAGALACISTPYLFFSIRFLLPPIPFKSMLLVSVKMSTISEIKTLVKAITTLSNSLPQSVQQGMKEDKIWSVMNTEEWEMAHETFNRCFDAMFGEDCWGASGCLQYVHKGRLGLGCVCSYLSKIDWADNVLLDIIEIKLQRLIRRLKHFQYIFTHFQPFRLIADTYASSDSDAYPTVQTWPSCYTAPTSKLTNANNAAQPELSFQCKAVQAFHTQWAWETTSVTGGDAPADTIGSTLISTPKQDINMTIYNESKDEDSDDQPKPCMFWSCLHFKSILNCWHRSQKATYYTWCHKHFAEKAYHYQWWGHKWWGWSGWWSKVYHRCVTV